MYFSGESSKKIWDLTDMQQSWDIYGVGQRGGRPICLVIYPALQASNLGKFEPRAIDFLCSIYLIHSLEDWEGDEAAAVSMLLCIVISFHFASLHHAVFPVILLSFETAASEFCCIDVHPRCFVRKHQGVLSKSLS